MVFDAEPEEHEPEGTVEDDMVSSEEEAFMQGYSKEEKIITCDECGVAIHGKPLVKVMDGESYKFCSEECAVEFAEGINV